MAGITTHILDISLGRPAPGVRVELEFDFGAFSKIAEGRTDADGRVKTWSAAVDPSAGLYRLRFFTREYFEQSGRESFYPLVEIIFAVQDPAQHYHVPLLLAPFGYSTYRGS